MEPFNSRGVRPAELELKRTSHFRILWDDGHESVFPLILLRKSCPCATCRTDREERQRNPLTILKAVGNAADAATVKDAELVGNYAIRFVWKDGHDTGIYDYRLLRSLCPCPDCSKINEPAGSEPHKKRPEP